MYCAQLTGVGTVLVSSDLWFSRCAQQRGGGGGGFLILRIRVVLVVVYQPQWHPSLYRYVRACDHMYTSKVGCGAVGWRLAAAPWTPLPSLPEPPNMFVGMSTGTTSPGLGLLPVTTALRGGGHKTLRAVQGLWRAPRIMAEGTALQGYEIHAGVTVCADDTAPAAATLSLSPSEVSSVVLEAGSHDGDRRGRGGGGP